MLRKFLEFLRRARMRRFFTAKRRDMLVAYCLNCSVLSFGVAMFEGKTFGIIPALVTLWWFVFLTKEDG